MLAEVLEEIYNEKVKPAEGEILRKYYEANREKFEEATAKGMTQRQNPNIADDKVFLKKYRHSIDVFSAFRSHAYAKRLADDLTTRRADCARLRNGAKPPRAYRAT